MKKFTGVAIATLLLCSAAFAMQRGRRGWYQSADNRNGVPVWESNQNFPHDVFTFVRVRYSDYGGGYGRRRGGDWSTDWPDADLNFSLRLQQLTSMKVNPYPEILDLTDPRLFDYPFLYMIEPGGIALTPPEIEGLQKYCNNGGFMMVDDFWGDEQWRNFEFAMQQVFPNRKWEEVPLDHEIFQIVYPLTEKPQVPSIHSWYPGGPTYEMHHGPNTETPHYRAIFDDDRRIMVFICHNTDLGDGWEREGENHEYFAEFSVKKSYPLGINIVTYAMTH